MRNLILFAVAFSVCLTETDVEELGYDVTEVDFRNYFGIPEDAVSGEFVKSEGFTVTDLKYFMNGEELEATASKADVKPSKKTAAQKNAPVDAPAEVPTEKGPTAAEKKAEEKAKKDAEKEEAAKKKEEEKAKKLAEKEEAKKAKEEEKKKKAAEREAAKVKNLSRSQQIYIYHSQDKGYKEVADLHPDWAESHIKNSLYFAKNNPEAVEVALKLQADIEARTSTTTETAEAPKEVQA